MENKIETPLQRLITEYDSTLEYFESTYKDDDVLESTKERLKIRISQLKHDRRKAVNLLPYEREVIENVVTEIMEDMTLYESFRTIKNASEYYNQTFQTNEQ